MTDRTASTQWTGDLANGSGTTSLDSTNTATFEVSWPARTEAPGALTSPEELLAAAHSSCYSMQLAGLLAAASMPPDRISTTATATFSVGSTGASISQIRLTVRAQVPGADEASFLREAEQAKRICPVSAALTGTTITLDAALG